ncbi:hypothetical protein [Jejuia pallidilutea]|uniref:Uncharacterized protein n=1 Tax=Jejuia pallidilutea TaxID=504487 RepID=A0A090VL81_9FLAO|nr:hypothetical protein [Jejuia pallidilutea]GAL65490.1 hypothetical protein JCM19301_3950 [Jejuia pallidilutea]GAL70050.1 hypothetical protein JCM19302_2625 [Jejuia pallidilutea]GAL88961.1 hypothetical protein JCM19538_1950 [Jejuia pallidilutea]
MNKIDVIYEYDNIINRLSEDIKKSDYKIQFFLKLLNLKRSFFYKKLREKRFTSAEMKLLSKHLYPEEYQNYQDTLLSGLLEKSRQQLKEGKTIDFENTIEASKRKYNVL